MGLPRIWGDRVQLATGHPELDHERIEAMSEVDEGSRELLIGSRLDTSDAVVVAVARFGPGIEIRDR